MLCSLFEISSIVVIFFLLLACFFARRQARVQEVLYELDDVVERHAVEQFGQSQGFAHVKNITLVIPALNERENLGQILPRLPKSVCGQPLGVVLIDDGSTDGTAELARSYDIGVVSTPNQRGQGAALRLGYRLALAGGAGIVVIMDADGQNRPEEIEGLIEPILADSADFVIGSRMLGRFEKDDPVRLLGVRFFSPLTSFLIGTKITDCSSGFRGMKSSVLSKIVGLLRQRQYSMSELNIEVARSGFRIKEVPITFLKRMSGNSKKGHNLFYAFAFARAIFSTFLRTNPTQKDTAV
jgi:glycosyltransferase involved in cell wall biosynthesis